MKVTNLDRGNDNLSVNDIKVNTSLNQGKLKI